MSNEVNNTFHQSTVTHYLHPSSITTTTTPSVISSQQPTTTTTTSNSSLYLGGSGTGATAQTTGGISLGIGTTTTSCLQPYSSYTSSTVPLDANDIFPLIKKRKGKWTQEEENYANFLVREFENGTVPDCENGNTLRAFLSRKLHCAPMRISKKFAGKSIGKHVFIARISTATTTSLSSAHNNNNCSITTTALKDNNDTLFANRIKLRELEQAFLKSITEEISVPLPLSMVQMMSQNNFSGNHHHRRYNNNNNAPSHHHQQGSMNTNISTVSIHNNKSTEFPMSVHDNSNKHNNSSIENPSACPTSANSSAYYQYHPQLVQQANKSSCVNSGTQPEPIDLTKQEDNDNNNANSLQSNVNNESTASQLHATNALISNISTTKKQQQQQTVSSAVGCETLLPNGILSMTDFLAGFDNINNNIGYKPFNNNDNALSSTNNNNNSGVSSARNQMSCNNDDNHKQQFTECQTTQSFDDLHQFLGKEIPNTTITSSTTTDNASITESITKKTITELERNNNNSSSNNNNNNGRSTITITTHGTKDGLRSTTTCEPPTSIQQQQHPFDEKQQQALLAPKISTSPGDNVLISDEGLVHNSYCSIVKTSYNCQDNDITAPTLTTTSTQSEQHQPSSLSSSSSNTSQNNKYHHRQYNLDTTTTGNKKNISYDDYALFAQSACNGIRDYYYHSSYNKLRRSVNHHHHHHHHNNTNNALNTLNKIRSSTTTTKAVPSTTANSLSSSSCLGKRSADVM